MASLTAKRMQLEERIIQIDVDALSHVFGCGNGSACAASNRATANVVPGGTLFVADCQQDASIDRTES